MRRVAANVIAVPRTIPAADCASASRITIPMTTTSPRTESDANANLAGTPLNEIRHQPVESHAGEHERQEPEERRENRDASLLAQRLFDVIGQRLDA